MERTSPDGDEKLIVAHAFDAVEPEIRLPMGGPYRICAQFGDPACRAAIEGDTLALHIADGACALHLTLCGKPRIKRKDIHMNVSTEKFAVSAQIEQIAANVVHVRYCPEGAALVPSALIDARWKPSASAAKAGVQTREGSVLFQNAAGDVILEETGHALEPKETFRYTVDGEPVIRHKQTANGDVSYIENASIEKSGNAYRGLLSFRVAADEHLYGLGQHDRGLYDYRGQREYMFQTNMKISIPFLISSKNYGLLIDTETAMIFSEQNGEMRFALETVHELSYYVITGICFDEIIATLRGLTGGTPMLPRWAFGYMQSKERYHSAEELTDAAEKFRALGIPVDCLVQDWYTWENGLWGEKRPDPKRYPDLRALTDSLHRQHVKLMVSIWPNMAPGGADYAEFRQKNLLLPNSFVYDAYSEEGRALYWKQCDEALV